MSEILFGQRGQQVHIQGPLMAQSLVDKQVLHSTATEKEWDILPYVNVIGIGGRSIMDRGRKAVLPLAEEIVRNRGKHMMILGVSGGTRTRHVYAIALDLGIPTGGLARIAGASEEQNQKMLLAILAKDGGVQLAQDHFWDLPDKLAGDMIPIMIAMPPYHYWEQPPYDGRLPMNGSDLGFYVFAETLGVRSLIYVKDQDGLYTADPTVDRQAEFISQISVQELRRRAYPDLIVEPMVLETMLKARHVKRIQIINGLKPGNLTAALNGEAAGTIIYVEDNRAIAEA